MANNTEYCWLIELRKEPGGRDLPQPLYLFGSSPQSIAEAIISADDEGKTGIGTCWTNDPYKANRWDEIGAKQTAAALDRCCGGICAAAEHGFIHSES